MNTEIALFLAQDGIVNGAVYALLALALVLAFNVTRVILIPQGEFVAWGALTLDAVQHNRLPGTIFVLLALGLVIFTINLTQAVQDSALRTKLFQQFSACVLYPALLWLCAKFMPWDQVPMLGQILFTALIVVPLGPMVWRLAFQPIAQAPALTLLIVAIAVHLAMIGIGLWMFGPEGSRTPSFTEGSLELGSLTLQAQTLWVLGCSLTLIVVLYLFFEKTFYGKVLRATAINREGARLMGIPTSLAGGLSFALCAFIGVLSGVLIAPITTIYYDTGFLIGLKGFVGAIIAGLVSYPVAALGAVLVGLLESYASFYASAYKEVIVFTLIIPVLAWRSLGSKQVEE